MSTQSLVVELDAKTQKLDAALKSTDQKLAKLERQTKKNDNSFKKFGATTLKSSKYLLNYATAASAAAAAVTAIAVASAKSYRSQELYARQLGKSVDEMNALTFATSQYGVSAEKMGDISKDLSDRFGEFSTAGTGAFQDLLDVMGLTKQEGIALSGELGEMSGDEALGAVVDMMEKAGKSTEQMVFVMESLAGDASLLIPVFANQSAELNKLSSAYKAANDQMKITGGQADDLRELATSFDLMKNTAGNAAISISATLAPTLTKFFQDTITLIPQAEQAIVEFLNRFIEVENKNTLDGVELSIKANTSELEEAEKELDEMQKRRDADPSFYKRKKDQIDYQEAEQQEKVNMLLDEGIKLRQKRKI